MRWVWWMIGSAAATASCGVLPETGPVEASSSGSVISEAARAAEARLRSSAIAPFEVTVGLVDRYGNESTAPALALSWSEAELAKVNPANADGYRLVDLADISIQGVRGVVALSEWCDENGRALTPRLCGGERSRAEDEWARLLGASVKTAG